MSNDFGRSNIHLKIGIALMPIAAAMLAMVFVLPSTARYMSGDVRGLQMLGGMAVYVIGRVAKVWRARNGHQPASQDGA